MLREGRGLREIGALIGCHASTLSRTLQIKNEKRKKPHDGHHPETCRPAAEYVALL
ncbi:helix-turn-helix domain-containing protein [Bradyrhizobium yuanmingense]|uniref:helix-turn-helix domain-containing protein n=1 Tax=Bradyrhizobium yuanmingense TaxID=108015 RepID=UPI0023BA0847|nr:helix-turn-helix domain-containing protein [Bradyrhizobium yuanmingense]MDF0515757.1 helix-turn-helix domain-containing protein [Bradyrhizobium yuanmingense]